MKSFNLADGNRYTSNLITAAMSNWDELLARSLKHYLVPGFNSIILRHSPSLTLRLYVLKPGESSLAGSLSPANNVLWIHNHNFAFRCQTIVGWMKNLLYSEVSCSTDQGAWFKYNYQSALKSSDGRMHLCAQGPVNLALNEVEYVPKGFYYEMQPQQLHRILVPEDDLVVLLFWQYQKVPITQQLYSNKELEPSPDLTGLNQKFNSEELRALLEMVLARLRHH